MYVVRLLFGSSLHPPNVCDYLDKGEFDLVENVSVSSALLVLYIATRHTPYNLTYFSDIHMLNAQNGVRIKSWAGPNVGTGLVKNICKVLFRLCVI
jgi:hypothetical protein